MDTDSFEEQLREGEERLARGQAAEAVSCLQRCVELRPNDARARLSLGQALSESGRDAEALGQLEQAIALDASQVYNHGWWNILDEAVRRPTEQPQPP